MKQHLKLLFFFLIQTLQFHAADMKTKDSELNIYAVIDFNLLLILFLNVLWLVIFVSVCLNFCLIFDGFYYLFGFHSIYFYTKLHSSGQFSPYLRAGAAGM